MSCIACCSIFIISTSTCTSSTSSTGSIDSSSFGVISSSFTSTCTFFLCFTCLTCCLYCLLYVINIFYYNKYLLIRYYILGSKLLVMLWLHKLLFGRLFQYMLCTLQLHIRRIHLNTLLLQLLIYIQMLKQHKLHKLFQQ